MSVGYTNDLSYEDTQEQGEIRSLSKNSARHNRCSILHGEGNAIKTFKNDKAPGMEAW